MALCRLLHEYAFCPVFFFYPSLRSQVLSWRSQVFSWGLHAARKMLMRIRNFPPPCYFHATFIFHPPPIHKFHYALNHDQQNKRLLKTNAN